MELQNFCDNMAGELNAWKAKVGDITTKFDHTATGDKTNVVPFINELHMVLEEIDDRILKLRNECPTSFEREKEELEGKFTHMQRIVEGAPELSPADFGG
jgi:hypothetical protein